MKIAQMKTDIFSNICPKINQLSSQNMKRKQVNKDKAKFKFDSY